MSSTLSVMFTYEFISVSLVLVVIATIVMMMIMMMLMNNVMVKTDFFMEKGRSATLKVVSEGGSFIKNAQRDYTWFSNGNLRDFSSFVCRLMYRLSPLEILSRFDWFYLLLMSKPVKRRF